MKYIYIILLFANLYLNSLFAQSNTKKKFTSERSNFSIGLTGGYNSISGNFSIYIGYRVLKFAEFNINGGANRLEGAAYSFGVRITPIKDKRFLPYVGINYNSHSAGSFETGTDTMKSVYRNTPNNNLLYQLGVIYEESFVSIFLSINYKQILKQPTLILDRGKHDYEIENRANRLYKNGTGVTLGLIFHIFDKKHKESKTSADNNKAQF